MKRLYIIFGVMVIMFLLMNSVSAISKEDYRDFLKQELNKYFNGESTLLGVSELRIAIDYYFNVQGNEVDISQSGLSSTSQNILGSKNLGLIEEFECTLTATGTEKWEEKEETQVDGYKVKCCSFIIPHWMGASCAGDIKYTECIKIKKSVLGVSAGDGKNACQEIFGSNYRVGWGLFGIAKGTQKCDEFKTTVIPKTQDRNETDVISFTLDNGQTKTLAINLDVYPNSGGTIENIQYKINCQDSEVSGHIADGKIYVSRK